MLLHYIRTTAGRRRHLNTPVGQYLDGFAAALEGQGFAHTSIHSDLKIATAFGEYLLSVKQDLREVRTPDVDRFVEWWRRGPRHAGRKRTCPHGTRGLEESLRGRLGKLLRHLRGLAIVPAAPAVEDAPPPHASVLREYLAFLRVHRGLAPRSLEAHTHWGEALLRQLGARCPSFRLNELTSRAVEAAVDDLIAAGSSSCRAQRISTTVAAFVRYLKAWDHAPDTCQPFLPRRRYYALAPLPGGLDRNEVERVLASIDRDSGAGLRDHAILQLCASYGLRSSELIGLRLEDIDWRGEVLRVRQTKTRRDLRLPLLKPVAEALLAYLRAGRPKTTDRRVFQRVVAPLGPLTGCAVTSLVRKAIVGAGVAAPHYGPHVLRHSLATSLVRRGNTLKLVGDLLGHRDPNATAIYCKLAVEDLRCVALELPEVAR